MSWWGVQSYCARFECLGALHKKKAPWPGFFSVNGSYSERMAQSPHLLSSSGGAELLTEMSWARYTRPVCIGHHFCF